MYLQTNESELKKMTFIQKWKLKTSIIAWSKFYWDTQNYTEYNKMKTKLAIVTKYLPDKIKDVEVEG